MRHVLLIAGLLCSGTHAFALLGDTRAAADQRYGVARAESPGTRERPLVEGAHHAIYHFEGFEIYCAFLKATDGQSYCVRERYERLRSAAPGQPRSSAELEEFELNAFLATQGGGAAWRESDRSTLGDATPEWLGKRLRSYDIGTLWTRKDGALAEVGMGNRWITFSHPQALMHEAQVKHGGAASQIAAVEQFVASISEAHRAATTPSASSSTLAMQAAPRTGAGSATTSTPYPRTEGAPVPQATPIRDLPRTSPKAGSEDLKKTLGNVGMVGVVVIALARIFVAGLKGTSRRERKRSPLWQSACSSPPPLRVRPVAIAAPRPQSLNDLEWDEFELLVGEIYRRQGYYVEISSGDGADGGIDLVLRKNGETVLVQCKHWQTSKVGAKEIREFYGVLVSEGASRGIFVTTHEYSRDAIEFAAGKPLELINRAGLAELIVMGQRSDMADLLDIPEWAPFFKSGSQVLVPTCPYCKATMLLRNSKAGAFWGCRSYPKCRGTRKTKRHLVG